MSKVSVFDQGWIDLVFEGRNHEYGAYQLRKEDSRTTVLAFITGVGLMALLVAVPVAVNYFGTEQIAPVVTDLTGTKIIELDNVFPLDEPKKPEPVVEQPAAAAPPSSNATTQFNQPVASSEPVVDPIPNTTQLLTTDPGPVTTPGDQINGNPLGVAGNPPGGTGEGTGTTPTGDGIATTATVDVMPAFPGGIEAFYRQVGNRFRTPELDMSKTLKVYVSFVVETDGSMTNFKVARDPGYGLGNEAIRVLKSIKTKWEPGQIKGKKVRTAYNLPITVNIK